MNKKWLCAGLSALVALTSVGMLAGCNRNSDTDSQGRIKVSVGMWPENTASDHDKAMFTQWKQAFEADHPEYVIIGDPYTYSVGDIHNKAPTGQLPVVFQTYFTEPQKLIEWGYITDVDAELKQLGWLDKMDEAMREAVSKDGKCYGVPRDGYGLGLLLNLEMLESVEVIGYDDEADEYLLYKNKTTGEFVARDEYVQDGKTGNNIVPAYPTTFEELEVVSQAIVDGYSGKYGLPILSSNRNGGWQFANIAWNFGCEELQVKENGKWKANLNCDEAVAALEWIKNMKINNLVYPDASLSYNDWTQKFGNQEVAMTFCGSDALMLPVTTVDKKLKDKIAFVPMPSVEGKKAYSLYGGTPFVFSSKSTARQRMGALMFLEYMGRSPLTTTRAVEALVSGQETAQKKGMPILPTIKPWVNEDYLTVANSIENDNINVNLDYYQDFLDTLSDMKHKEEPNYCQEMYSLLDDALQSVLSKPVQANCKSLLNTANSTFQSTYLNKVKG